MLCTVHLGDYKESAAGRRKRTGIFFKTKEEFEELIRQDALYEYAQYVDNYYGTPKAYVEEQLAAGKDVILEIEVQGALKVKRRIRRLCYYS